MIEKLNAFAVVGLSAKMYKDLKMAQHEEEEENMGIRRQKENLNAGFGARARKITQKTNAALTKKIVFQKN